MRTELDQIDRDLVTIGARIVDPTLTTEERAQLARRHEAHGRTQR